MQSRLIAALTPTDCPYNTQTPPLTAANVIEPADALVKIRLFLSCILYRWRTIPPINATLTFPLSFPLI